MSRRRLLVVSSIVMAVVIAVVLLASKAAPENSEVVLSERTCIEKQDEQCLIFPTITGTNLSGDDLTLPQDFTGETTLVVVPFDRDQQVRADTWLPFAKALQETHPEFDFFDVPIFPDLAAPIRLIARTGMVAIISDNFIRERTVLVFLTDRDAFLDAMDIADVEQIQLFLLNSESEVIWRGVGPFTEEQGEALTDVLANGTTGADS